MADSDGEMADSAGAEAEPVPGHRPAAAPPITTPVPDYAATLDSKTQFAHNFLHAGRRAGS
jgi:hypothetical protein